MIKNISYNKYIFLDYHSFIIFMKNFCNNIDKKYIINEEDSFVYNNIDKKKYYINVFKTKNYDIIKKILYINNILVNYKNFINIYDLICYSKNKNIIYYKNDNKIEYNHNKDKKIYYLMEINKLYNLSTLDNYHNFFCIYNIKLILIQLLLYQIDIFCNHGIILTNISLDNIFIHKDNNKIIRYYINNIIDITSKYTYHINDYSQCIIYKNKLYYDKYNYDNNIIKSIYNTFIIMYKLFKFNNELEFYKNIVKNKEYNNDPLYTFSTCDMFCRKFLKLYYNNKLNYPDFINKNYEIVKNYINNIWFYLFHIKFF